MDFPRAEAAGEGPLVGEHHLKDLDMDKADRGKIARWVVDQIDEGLAQYKDWCGADDCGYQREWHTGWQLDKENPYWTKEDPEWKDLMADEPHWDWLENHAFQSLYDILWVNFEGIVNAIEGDYDDTILGLAVID
jgi:hypothetical protein